MERQRVIATVLAGVGVVLQLAGLAWDSVLHAADPGLVAREGIFTLVNPSHALVAGGLGLTVAAIVALLALIALAPGRSAGGRRLALAGAVVLVVGFGGATALGVVTGGRSGDPSHAIDPGHHEAGPDRLGQHPMFLALQEVLRKHGTEKALQQLAELAASDPAVLGASHQLAHALGRYSFFYYRDPAVAFRRCRETFESGCYHGVLEAYFGSLKTVGRAQVVGLCDRAASPQIGSILRFQCVHGIGHGLAGHFRGDIPRALSSCDALSSEWDQSSCYLGVFMENVTVAYHLKYGSQSTHAHGDFRVALKADDPQYPCSAVGERYKVSCYEMQSSAMLLTNGFDFDRAFTGCDAAPAPYIGHCYLSMGRDIAGFVIRDPAKSIAMCSRGRPAHRGHCFAGVAKNLIGASWRVEPAVAFCRQSPADAKPLCYQAIGDQVTQLHTDAAAKERACATVEAAFVQTCRRAARLLS